MRERKGKVGRVGEAKMVRLGRCNKHVDISI